MDLFIACMIILGLVMIVALSEYMDDKQAEKEQKEAEIERIKNCVIEDFKELEDYTDNYGIEFYTSLIDFAKKMEKLCEPNIKCDLHPYDTYNISKIIDNKTFKGHSLLGRIVIDKALTPKFMMSCQSTIPSICDIQLEAALTANEVKELAEKCRKIKMDKDIETYRKNKVREAINGK